VAALVKEDKAGRGLQTVWGGPATRPNGCFCPENPSIKNAGTKNCRVVKGRNVGSIGAHGGKRRTPGNGGRGGGRVCFLRGFELYLMSSRTPKKKRKKKSLTGGKGREKNEKGGGRIGRSDQTKLRSKIEAVARALCGGGDQGKKHRRGDRIQARETPRWGRGQASLSRVILDNKQRQSWYGNGNWHQRGFAPHGKHTHSEGAQFIKTAGKNLT